MGRLGRGCPKALPILALNRATRLYRRCHSRSESRNERPVCLTPMGPCETQFHRAIVSRRWSRASGRRGNAVRPGRTFCPGASRRLPPQLSAASRWPIRPRPGGSLSQRLGKMGPEAPGYQTPTAVSQETCHRRSNCAAGRGAPVVGDSHGCRVQWRSFCLRLVPPFSHASTCCV